MTLIMDNHYMGLLFLAGFACILCVPACAAETVQPGPLPIISVIADPVYDSLLKPAKLGYLGADGAASIPIGNDRVLWIFGDTIIGSQAKGKRQGPMARNTIAIHEMTTGAAGTVKYFWDSKGRVPGGFFQPESSASLNWYWPGCGVMIDGTAHLFLTKLRSKISFDMSSFQTVGCTLFRVANPLDPPHSWRITRAELGFGNDHFNINTAAMAEGNYLYMIGYHDGPLNLPQQRAGILCRVPVAALKSDDPAKSFEFWSEGDQWLASHKHLKPLFRPGMTESSLHYDPVTKRYITVAIKPFSPDLCLLSAEKLTGPWSAPQKIHDIPGIDDNKKHLAYAGRAHPILSSDPNELVITYVINTTDFWGVFSELDIYYPRFVRAAFGADTGTAGAK
ncbi:MAG: DUF4185 domain-containing protein [bacterium]